MQTLPIQLLDLVLIQLANWRWAWRRAVLQGMLMPIFLAVLLGAFASQRGPEMLGYILTGNIVVSLLFETVGKVSSNFIYMRTTGMMDYLATLPIYRVALIVATMFAFLLLSLPSVVATLFAGTLVLGVPFQFNPLILIIVPLISLTLCGVGALIGLTGRNPEEVGTLSTLFTLVCMALGPVLIPASQLPPFVRVFGMFSPATYAASALRHVLLSTNEAIPLVVDIMVLLGISFGLLWIVGQRMDWREQ